MSDTARRKKVRGHLVPAQRDEVSARPARRERPWTFYVARVLRHGQYESARHSDPPGHDKAGRSLDVNRTKRQLTDNSIEAERAAGKSANEREVRGASASQRTAPAGG